MKVSVVVCVRNEEARIRECLEGIYTNDPDEVILVEGASTDRTVAIAREFSDIRIIESRNSNLTRDRQIGIDAARNDLIAMIDGDHRLQSGDLESLLRDMKEFNLDIVQAGLVSYTDRGFWHKAEGVLWELTQNAPGVRAMISTAPSIYRKRVFDHVRFDDRITTTVDDTDFFYRLSKFSQLRVGVGRTKVRQYHFASFGSYLKKFQMYGKGDGEFCRKHPNRAPSMLFHLLVRYPVIYSWRAIRAGKAYAVPFFVLHGTMRFVGLARYFLRAI